MKCACLTKFETNLPLSFYPLHFPTQTPLWLNGSWLPPCVWQFCFARTFISCLHMLILKLSIDRHWSITTQVNLSLFLLNSMFFYIQGQTFGPHTAPNFLANFCLKSCIILHSEVVSTPWYKVFQIVSFWGWHITCSLWCTLMLMGSWVESTGVMCVFSPTTST